MPQYTWPTATRSSNEDACKQAPTDPTSAKCTTLLSLPKEILFKIIQSIGLEDIKAVTRFVTSSKQSLLSVEAAAGCKLKAMLSLENRFGKPYFTLDDVACDLSQWDDLKERFLNITSNVTAPDLTCLNLDVSLSWLHPFDPETKAEMEPPHLGPAIKVESTRQTNRQG